VALLSSAILVFGQRVDLLERVFCLCGHCGRTQLQSNYWKIGEAVDDERAWEAVVRLRRAVSRM
jgi:hypothetical protein